MRSSHAGEAGIVIVGVCPHSPPVCLRLFVCRFVSQKPLIRNLCNLTGTHATANLTRGWILVTSDSEL